MPTEMAEIVVRDGMFVGEVEMRKRRMMARLQRYKRRVC
jgi:hypothetical protein